MSQSPAPSINLLSKRKARYDKQSGVAIKVKVWSGVVLIAYIGILVLTLVIAQIFSWKLSKEEKALSQAKLELASKIVLVHQYEVAQKKLTAIKKLLAERREVVSLWNGVRELIPDGVEMSGFSLSESQLQLIFDAPHVLLANQIIDVAETQFYSLGAETVTATVGRSDDASYQVRASLLLSAPSEKGTDEETTN